MKLALSFFLALILLTIPLQAQERLLWLDAEANFSRFSDKDSILYYFALAKETGFTALVLDVKPITGEVLYNSKFAPRMNDWQGATRDTGFNFVEYCISAARGFGLKIYASFNVFVAGHNYFDRGLVYTDKLHWQSLAYTDSGMVPLSLQKKKYSAMTNPADPEVQKHELNVLREFVSRYRSIDGIFLDRVRFDGIECDFTPVSRAAFEKYSGKKVKHFPDDIYRYEKKEGAVIRTPGKLYKKWLEWRVSVIYGFMEKARKVVKRAHKHCQFGVYTGAWYPVYFDVGVNWASNRYDPSKEYDWATPQYKKYGYAELLDMYSSGCYFREATIDELDSLYKKEQLKNPGKESKRKEDWYTVQGSAREVKKVLKGVLPFTAGLYVEQYAGEPEQFKKAIKVAVNESGGLMIFDIVHLVKYNWWKIVKEALSETEQK